MLRSCPHGGRGKYFGLFLAVPRVVGENILGVFLDSKRDLASKRDFEFEKGREFENIDFFKNYLMRGFYHQGFG